MNRMDRERTPRKRTQGLGAVPSRGTASERARALAGEPPRKRETPSADGKDRFTSYLFMQSVTAGTILAAMLCIRFLGGGLYSDIKEGVSESFLTRFDIGQASQQAIDYASGLPVFKSLFGTDDTESKTDASTQSSSSSGAQSSQAQSGGESQAASAVGTGASASGSGSAASGSDSASGGAKEPDFTTVQSGAAEGIGDGDVFRSILYAGDSTGSLRLQSGAALKPALPETLVAPANCREITSEYGYREDPFTGEKKFHNGLDIALDEGTRVNAALSGTVTEVDEDEISGKYIIIEHADGFKTLYAHLKKAHVREGAEVKAGQKIASSGNTGKTTGPHLHFSMLKDDGYINPALYLDV